VNYFSKIISKLLGRGGEKEWAFPLFPQDLTNMVRLTSEYGVFGFKRSYYYHQGVDLYVRGEAPIMSVEDGVVVSIVDFTGPPDHPHWLFTRAVMIQGASGVVCYGEMAPKGWVEVGSIIEEGEKIGNVSPVIPEGLERPDIFGHSRYMLHLELYSDGTSEPVSWHHEDTRPSNLLDPTDRLLSSWNAMAKNK